MADNSPIVANGSPKLGSSEMLVCPIADYTVPTNSLFTGDICLSLASSNKESRLGLRMDKLLTLSGLIGDEWKVEVSLSHLVESFKPGNKRL